MPPPPWIGHHPLEIDARHAWTLGAFELLAHRRELEWQLAARWADDPLSTALATGPASPEAFEACTWSIRASNAKTIPALELRARAADRPVIARPDTTLVIPPRAHASIFLGSAAWIELLLDEALVASLPSWRLSDTWFGRTTSDGTLCYASRTRARTSLPDVPVLPASLLTRATIFNGSERAFTVERIGIPMPSMSVFADDSGRVWTEEIRVDVESSGSSRTRVADAPGDGAERFERIAEPRTPPDAGGLVRAFSALIGGDDRWRG
ncbi:hypothetical protein ENSA5_08650 [Enhygromyxa salina]|uniref:Uncharacterized protein n=1 Tax=Enhygromyxa salina TaxID=215803 RepID=A0A2S9YGS9_9BACT|nr:hypothetical protein [Enhygromyxa salina]PRQ04299.1 hypothetical protein ENSA5_08650 [Enhygromyxa salina]